MVLGDSENMPLMIIILMRLQSFLVRNFETLEKGLAEILRVLKLRCFVFLKLQYQITIQGYNFTVKSYHLLVNYFLKTMKPMDLSESAAFI
jgi:demethylmenaquinone methyltransferase/2-methoxy-6-polyprenyl-1,4-benzoquinol methylase